MGKKQQKRKKAIQKSRQAASQAEATDTRALGAEDDSESEPEAGPWPPPRPFFVWIIVAYFVLSGATSIIFTVLIFSGVLGESVNFDDYIASAVLFRLLSVLYIAGGVSLFLYRRSSLGFFAAALALMVISHVLVLIYGGLDQYRGDRLLVYAPDWIILTVSTIYVWTLRRNRYLT